LRTGNARPERLTLVCNANAGVLLDALESQLELPASTLPLPEVFGAPSSVSVDGLLDEYPACLGALLALHRRARGENSAAPPLHRQKRAVRGAGWRGRRGLLMGLNAGLLALVLVLGLAVQSVRMSNAEKLIAGSEPIRTGLERLQEQVEILRFEEKRPRYLLDVLQGMAEALPPDIKVESLAIDSKGKVSLSAQAGSVEVASDAAMTALRESKMFMNPTFHGATKEKDGFGFRITCELRGGQGGGK
ncbi:MAG: PilN domain-containing protein, partial [FCB group bacterium]|jgi:Tfp pilus assembly protein PilN|nr:PilN domain-containing protein [FCB group bacterium]